ITGEKLLEKFRAHAESYSENIRIMQGDVISLMLGMGVNMISTRTSNITADVVIIASGKGHRKEIIEGEDALVGYGVSYCALCDGPLYRDRIVYLYGNDEEVVEDAMALHQMGCIVHVITNLTIIELTEIYFEHSQEIFENLSKIGIEIINRHHLHENHHDSNHHRIEIIGNMEIIKVVPNSDGIIQKIIFKSTKTEDKDAEELIERELNALFILTHLPSNTIFKKAGVELDDRGNVKVDDEQRTSLKGVYAAGDVTGGLYQVVFATAEGSRAGINACKYLRQLK
ncbi:hypothetical protein LCGC14_1128930, partial [marine sediment metagenome]